MLQWGRGGITAEVEKGVEHGSIAPRRIIDHGRRIWQPPTALVAISINRVIYTTLTDGPNRINSSFFHYFNIGKSFCYKFLLLQILQYRKVSFCRASKNNYFLGKYLSEPKLQFMYTIKYLCRNVIQKIRESRNCRRILTLISRSQKGS